MHASPDATQPLAIVIPHEQHLRHAIGNGGSSASIGDLCQDQKIQELILKECNALGRKNGFKAQELLQAVILTPDEWTPESGLVTAAQKIQRAKIAKTFGKEIKVCRLVLRSRSGFLTQCGACRKSMVVAEQPPSQCRDKPLDIHCTDLFLSVIVAPPDDCMIYILTSSPA